jgi:hypothetical protein
MPHENEEGRRQRESADGKRREEQHGERPSHEERAAQMGGGSVSTDDRVVREPVPLREPPEQVVSYQTSELPSPMPEYQLGSGGDVVKEQRGEQNDEAQKQGVEAKGQQQEQGHQQDEKSRHKDGGQQSGDKRQQAEQNEKNQANKQYNGEQQKQRDRGSADRDEHRERPHKKKKKHHSAANQPSWKTVVMSGVLALLCGVGGAWGYSAMFGESRSDKQDRSSNRSDKGGKSGSKSGGKSSGSKNQASASSQGGASASQIPGFNSAKDADTFKKELEHLAHRLDLLGGRIDQMTTNKDQTPPALHTLQRKVADMEAELDQVANLPSKLDQIERKFDDMQQEFKSLKERVEGTEVPLASELSPPSTGYDTRGLSASAADPADEATFKLGSGLLREGHYSQSYEVLRRLQRERPGDARVWYLSALAYGLSSGKWDGRAKQLAQHGVECERAGHPSSDQIDAALSGVGTPNGQTWLAEQRREVTGR